MRDCGDPGVRAKSSAAAAGLGNNANPETLGYEQIAKRTAARLDCVFVPHPPALRLLRGGGGSKALSRWFAYEMKSGPRPQKRPAMHRSILRTDQLRERLRASAKHADQQSSKVPLRHHLKVHLFRALTVVLAWFLIIAAFYELPEALTATQRLIQRGIESLGDTIPSPWGSRIEFVFREIGGFIWLQITLFVVLLRIVLSTLASMWRFIIRRDGVV